MSGQKTKTTQLDELSMHGELNPVATSIQSPEEPIHSHAHPAVSDPGLPHGGIDSEGEMAKADLYKIANYSTKLFKKLDNNTQLESWVQAKITKAADYIASVYHYIEYEMEFSEYGKKLDNAEVFNEETRAILKNKLMEAKEKIKELKKAQADKISGKKKETECVKETSEEKKKAYRDAAGKDMEKAAKAGDKEKVSKRLKGVSKSLKESEKPDYIDIDNDGDKKEPMKKAAKEKKCDEAAPSAGLSKKEKSATVKKAKAGKDIGKPGKGFKKVAAKAAKEYGSKEKGEKVAAAAMWKNIKKEDQVAEAVKKAKKDYDGDGKIESGKDEHAGSVDKAIKASKEKECVNESTDLTRMKEFLTRLNG